MRARAWRSFVALAALSSATSTTSGCLPRGEPPAGRQVLADAKVVLLGLVPALGDGVLRILFLRPTPDPDYDDLWVLAVDPNGQPATERRLLAGVSAIDELSYRPSAGSNFYPMDSRGRIYVSYARVDPLTGEEMDVGGWFAGISANRQRVLVTDHDLAGLYVLRELDDSTTSFAAKVATFVGDDLYTLTAEGDLVRTPPGGAPTLISTGVSQFQQVTERLLMLVRAAPDPSQPGSPAPDPGMLGLPPLNATSSILDATTLEDTPLPDGPQYQNGSRFSLDARWVVAPKPFGDLSIGQFPTDALLVDRLSGTLETVPAVFLFGGWRPGHVEIWASFYDSTEQGAAAGTLMIKRPGEPVVSIPGQSAGGFTDDGVYLITRSAPPDEAAASEVIALADDPTGPRFPLVPTHSSLVGLWTLADGRLLTQSLAGSADFFENFVAQVVDPRNGATQVIGEHGLAMAVGPTRMLGLFQVSFERGDLTSFDLARGQSTVLAQEFAQAAVVEPQGADPYPPGARIVYQFRARFASPWDGLWLATAP